jgi:hypothetical protein
MRHQLVHAVLLWHRLEVHERAKSPLILFYEEMPDLHLHLHPQ